MMETPVEIMLDGKRCIVLCPTAENLTATGCKIKASSSYAGIYRYQLYEERPGAEPDRMVGDEEAVILKGPTVSYIKSFFAIPPTTNG